jgi:hypothetical protein
MKKLLKQSQNDMDKTYYMSDEEFTSFLLEIGGVENGFFTDRPPIKERGFFGIGNGWLVIVKELIEKLIELGWDKQVCQVKEKFGGLRFYINTGSDEIHEEIMKADELSYKVCEVCGEAGVIRGDLRWWLTLCDEHYEQKKTSI